MDELQTYLANLKLFKINISRGVQRFSTVCKPATFLIRNWRNCRNVTIFVNF